MFGGFHGIGSLFGFVIQMLLLYWVVRWLFRRFAGGQPAFAGGPGFFARQSGPQPMGGGGGPPRRAPSGPPLALTPADYAEFEQLLKHVQTAWSAQDIRGLQAIATPEMVGVFGEQLAEQSSRGVRNTVTDVTLQSGDLSEAWSERGRDYATVAMRFSMIDATRDGSGRIVDGSASEHVTATEVWTFLRSQAAAGSCRASSRRADGPAEAGRRKRDGESCWAGLRAAAGRRATNTAVLRHGVVFTGQGSRP